MSPPKFISKFVKDHSEAVQNSDHERSWYFEQLSTSGDGNSKGHIHYGTFGFESNFFDIKTKTKKYKRETTDTEEIPLFYEFWHPANFNYAFVAFQSFQGRSCINLVMTEMLTAYEKLGKVHCLRYRKLLPTEFGSLYSDKPVKQLRLIRRNAPGDLTDKYTDTVPDAVDFELIITAKKKSNFGLLRSLSLNNDSGIVMHDGIEFNEAVAEVLVGGRRRRVPVLGVNGDAGVIDLTETTEKGPNGHPTFTSMERECASILKDFQKQLKDCK